MRVVDEGICRQAILGHVTVCTSDKLAASVVAVVAWKKNKKRKEKGGSSRSVGVWVGREKGRGREGKRNRKREKDTHTHTPKKPHTHTHTHTQRHVYLRSRRVCLGSDMVVVFGRTEEAGEEEEGEGDVGKVRDDTRREIADCNMRCFRRTDNWQCLLPTLHEAQATSRQTKLSNSTSFQNGKGQFSLSSKPTKQSTMLSDILREHQESKAQAKADAGKRTSLHAQPPLVVVV